MHLVQFKCRFRFCCLVFLTLAIFNIVASPTVFGEQFARKDVVQCTCPSFCISCLNDTCVACDEGHYLDSGTCHACQTHCTSCSKYGGCYTCLDGYYGFSCQYVCSKYCLKNICDKENGTCLYGCVEGYFVSGVYCSICNFNCKTCTDYSNRCMVCKDGLYGPSCQNNCSHCKDSRCTKDSCLNGCDDGFYKEHDACSPCNEACTSCDTFHDCHACADGYHGPKCQFECSGCRSCNKENGSCTGTTIRLLPIATKEPTTLNVLATSSFAKTTLFRTASLQPSTTRFPTIASTQSLTNISKPLTNTDANVEAQSQGNSSVDSIIITYAAAGAGSILVLIILIVVVIIVCKKRRLSKLSDSVGENMDMTENEYYLSADAIDESLRKSTSAHSVVNYGGKEADEAVYSISSKTNRPSVVTME